MTHVIATGTTSKTSMRLIMASFGCCVLALEDTLFSG